MIHDLYRVGAVAVAAAALALGGLVASAAAAPLPPDHPSFECRERPYPGPRWCPTAHRERADASARARAAARAAIVANPRDPRGYPDANAYRLAGCETGYTYRPTIVDPSGTYSGLYQFDRSTWRSYGGSTATAGQASPAEQHRVFVRLRAARGYQPFPACRARLGLP